MSLWPLLIYKHLPLKSCVKASGVQRNSKERADKNSERLHLKIFIYELLRSIRVYSVCVYREKACSRTVFNRPR